MLLPYIFAGAFACKGKVFQNISIFLETRFTKLVFRNSVVVVFLAICTLLFCIFEKSLLLLPYTLTVFFLFPIMEKTTWLQRGFLFLGKHSTNIWLIHMFFYLVLFRGLVLKLKYPLLMFVGIMVLSIASSYVIQGILFAIDKVAVNIKEKVRCL